jgi:coatomer subunit beta
MACKRNAFVMLVNCAPELAVEYLEANINQVPNFDELLQMAIVDLIRKDCKNNAANKVSIHIAWIVFAMEDSSRSIRLKFSDGCNCRASTFAASLSS